MRSLLAVVLAFSFIFQSSGSALAAPSTAPQGPSLLAAAQFHVRALIAAFESTRFGALIGGNTVALAGYSMAPPDPTAAPTMYPVMNTHRHDWVMPTDVSSQGTRFIDPKAPTRPNAPWNAPADPAAMSSSNCNGNCSLPYARRSTRPTIALGSVRFDATATPYASPTPTPQTTQTPSPSPAPTPTYNPAGPSTTGINPWWTYEEHAIPGVGRAMVNVANGNLVVQADDLSIPERGVSLSFRRTYNSQSRHDYNNTDSSTRDLYGNGWTNTWDAHISYSGGTTPTIYVYDVDGTRYAYKSDGAGNWTAPAGMQGTTLAPDAVNPCYYDWTKKSGTEYQFFSWNYNGSGCPGAAGLLNGRIYRIYGRNVNNDLEFDYSYTVGGSITSLTKITVQQGGVNLANLLFGQQSQPNDGHVLLNAIQLLDQGFIVMKTISYYYDSSDNLTDVCELGNSNPTYAASEPCQANSIHEQYAYGPNHQLMLVNSPNWVMTDYGCGSYHAFSYDGENRVIALQDDGTINPSIPDGTTSGEAASIRCLNDGSTLQPDYPMTYGASSRNYWSGSFTYGAGTASLTDSDGHRARWDFDGSSRVTQMSEGWNGAWMLTSLMQWDSQNNLIETTDPRNQVTDYAYDGNGNTIAVALPAPSPGGTRPTSYYSYDVQTQNGVTFNYNNVTAYCDPQTVGSAGYDWANRPINDHLCTAATARTFTWDHSDGSEPFGRLTAMKAANGYVTTLTYPSSPDYGLPSDVQSACITQGDGTQRCPHQTFAYDSYGNLTSYSSASGASGNWTLAYDYAHRLTSATDPTGVTSYKYYYDDGSASKTETAYQHANGTGPQFIYDADGNMVEETASHGGTYNSSGSTPTFAAPQQTYKFYDAADRLVEVVQPHDANADIYAQSWITRYIYDISESGDAASLTFNHTTLSGHAYGNLYKTQEWLPASRVLTESYSDMTQTTFQDQKAQTFDPLDRVVTKTQFVNQNSTDVLNTDTNTYDTGADASDAGLLTKSCNALNTCTNYSYDDEGHTSALTFTDGTPSRTYTYDLDGRTLSASNTYGIQTYSYDVYGRLTSSSEGLATGNPNGVTLTGSTTLTYHYYDDGKRSALDVATNGTGAFTQTSLFAYAYRTDGILQWQQINDGSIPGFTQAGTLALSMTYDNVGRLTKRVESGVGSNSTPITATYDANGMATSKSYPGGTLASIQYDAGGAPIGYQPTYPGQTYFPTEEYSYTTRGELEHSTAESQTTKSQTASLWAAPPSISLIRVHTRRSIRPWGWCYPAAIRARASRAVAARAEAAALSMARDAYLLNRASRISSTQARACASKRLRLNPRAGSMQRIM